MAELAYENSRQPPQGSLTLHGRMAWTLALTVGTSRERFKIGHVTLQVEGRDIDKDLLQREH